MRIDQARVKSISEDLKSLDDYTSLDSISDAVVNGASLFPPAS